MAVIVISSDEWLPYYDIRKLKDGETYSEFENIAYLDDDKYIVYKGLLVQMELLQGKLEKLYKEGNKS